MRIGMIATSWLMVLGGVGCGASQYVIEDKKPLANAWAELSLQLTGPDNDDDNREACTEVARSVGVRLNPAAPNRISLYFSDDGNKVITAAGERPIGKGKDSAMCKLAIGAGVDIENRVRTVKEPPQGCEDRGPVKGQDEGVSFFTVNMGSYPAALMEAQLQVAQRGGNAAIFDVMQQFGPIVAVNGRAFRCGPNAPPPVAAPQ